MRKIACAVSITLFSLLGAPANANYGQTLQWHENLGGHTIARHAGKTRSWLLNRCATTPGLAEASSWSSVTAGQSLVNSTLAANRSRIESWKQTTEPRLILRQWSSSNSPNGIHVRCPSTVNSAPTRRVVVLARSSASPSGWFVLTSYPAP